MYKINSQWDFKIYGLLGKNFIALFEMNNLETLIFNIVLWSRDGISEIEN